jgi:hypothetical protein
MTDGTPDLSDEQTWWSTLFIGGADPGMDVPDEVWDEALSAALDTDIPLGDDALVPSDDYGMAPDEADYDSLSLDPLDHLAHPQDEGHHGDVADTSTDDGSFGSLDIDESGTADSPTGDGNDLDDPTEEL